MNLISCPPPETIEARARAIRRIEGYFDHRKKHRRRRDQGEVTKLRPGHAR